MWVKSPTIGVVEAVSRQTDTDPLELPPLYEAIDPNALDNLFNKGGGDSSVDSVHFDYAGHSVTVTGNGTIDVST